MNLIFFFILFIRDKEIYDIFSRFGPIGEIIITGHYYCHHVDRVELPL